MKIASKYNHQSEDCPVHRKSLLLVPGTLDTEESRPLTLLGFLEHALERFDFDFVSVSDDESFLAADRLAADVLGDAFSSAPPDESTWRSSFRRRVQARHYGEYPETLFQGAEYPALPSESGSVLSRALVHRLLATARGGTHAEWWLAPARDLASSLGVWLAPFAPRLLEDTEFSLENRTCEGPLKAFGPVADEQTFKDLWDNYSRCSKLCSCPKTSSREEQR